MIDLTNRETSVLLGLLNDASGYPYDSYEPGIKENKEKFAELFDKLYKNNSLEDDDLALAVLALTQAARHHTDGGDLVAIHDNVSLEEISSLLKKLKGISKSE